MRVLLLTSHYSPNIGGVETHLSDLVQALTKKKIFVDVLTYMPLVTKAEWKISEVGENFTIFRIPWFRGLFYQLVKTPILEFAYLLPGLFLITPLLILRNNPKVIHSQGLVAGFVGAFWGNLFKKRTVVSLHSIYHFPRQGLYNSFVKWIFKNSDYVLCLSHQSAREVKDLGLDATKVKVFTYWIDLGKFKDIKRAKSILGWEDKFVVLFVGRLIEEKGLLPLIEASKSWEVGKTLVIAGTGPLEDLIKKENRKIKCIKFVGRIDQSELPKYYSAADLLIVPSVHEEGFGRVILESLACGTPVIGSNRGAIPEAMNEDVGVLIEVTPENINKAIDFLYKNPYQLQKLSKNCRKFAEDRYSEKNVETIIKSYE